MGKFVNEGMAELGAERIYKYGEGNAEGNHTEDDFNEWKADLWSELCDFYKTNPIKGAKSAMFIEEQKDPVAQAPSGSQVSSSKAMPLIVEVIPKDVEVKFDDATPLELASKQYLTGKNLRIKNIIELRQSTEGGSTLEITYDMKDSGLSYKTANNLAFFPENSSSDVRLCADLLKLESLDARFVFKPNPLSVSKRATAAK